MTWVKGGIHPYFLSLDDSMCNIDILLWFKASSSTMLAWNCFAVFSIFSLLFSACETIAMFLMQRGMLYCSIDTLEISTKAIQRNLLMKPQNDFKILFWPLSFFGFNRSIGRLRYLLSTKRLLWTDVFDELGKVHSALSPPLIEFSNLRRPSLRSTDRWALRRLSAAFATHYLQTNCCELMCLMTWMMFAQRPLPLGHRWCRFQPQVDLFEGLQIDERSDGLRYLKPKNDFKMFFDLWIFTGFRPTNQVLSWINIRIVFSTLKNPWIDVCYSISTC